MKVEQFTFDSEVIRVARTDRGVLVPLVDVVRALGGSTTATSQLAKHLTVYRDIFGDHYGWPMAIDMQGLADVLRIYRRRGKAHRAAALQHFFNNTVVSVCVPAKSEEQDTPQKTGKTNKQVAVLLLTNTLGATEGLVRDNIQMALELLKE